MVGIGAKFKHTLACGAEQLGGCMWGLGAQNPEWYIPHECELSSTTSSFYKKKILKIVKLKKMIAMKRIKGPQNSVK